MGYSGFEELKGVVRSTVRLRLRDSQTTGGWARADAERVAYGRLPSLPCLALASRSFVLPLTPSLTANENEDFYVYASGEEAYCINIIVHPDADEEHQYSFSGHNPQMESR